MPATTPPADVDMPPAIFAIVLFFLFRSFFLPSLLLRRFWLIALLLC